MIDESYNDVLGIVLPYEGKAMLYDLSKGRPFGRDKTDDGFVLKEVIELNSFDVPSPQISMRDEMDYLQQEALRRLIRQAEGKLHNVLINSVSLDAELSHLSDEDYMVSEMSLTVDCFV